MKLKKKLKKKEVLVSDDACVFTEIETYHEAFKYAIGHVLLQAPKLSETKNKYFIKFKEQYGKWQAVILNLNIGDLNEKNSKQDNWIAINVFSDLEIEFISGLPPECDMIRYLNNKEYYLKYIKIINDNFKKIKDKTLENKLFWLQFKRVEYLLKKKNYEVNHEV